MLIRISDRSEAPLHSQIAGQVRHAIVRGDVKDGERLPPVRRLADALGVNMHTVLRAYRDLEAEGVIDLRQGRGATVRPGGRQRARELLNMLDRIFTDAGKRGLTTAQVTALLEGQL
jgi:DNA-binding transcriptional regulator YhcF (GntR family)